MCNSPVHYIAAKIKVLLSQTLRHAAQSLLALCGVGIIEDGELCWSPPIRACLSYRLNRSL